MEKRKFEKLGIESSLLGFGCMRFPLDENGNIEEKEAEQMLDIAIANGVTYIDTTELNDKLYSNGNYYYLYIDAVSYYHKVDVSYEEDDSLYYSKEIDIQGKQGYLEIQEQENGMYVIEFVYNYAKIEAMVSEEDINEVVLNASYILSTVQFNNDVIKLMLNETYFTNKEETYDIFEDKEDRISSSNLVEYEDETVEEEKGDS